MLINSIFEYQRFYPKIGILHVFKNWCPIKICKGHFRLKTVRMPCTPAHSAYFPECYNDGPNPDCNLHPMNGIVLPVLVSRSSGILA